MILNQMDIIDNYLINYMHSLFCMNIYLISNLNLHYMILNIYHLYYNQYSQGYISKIIDQL